MPYQVTNQTLSFDVPADWVLLRIGWPSQRSTAICPEHTSVRLSYPTGEALDVKVHWEAQDGCAVFTGTEEKTGYRMVAATAPSNTGALQNFRGEQSSERGKDLIGQAYRLGVAD
jgi:hypothetical protein